MAHAVQKVHRVEKKCYVEEKRGSLSHLARFSGTAWYFKYNKTALEVTQEYVTGLFAKY